MKSMFIPYISEYEITETVKSLKNRSAGWDFIPASIAKQCLKHYIKPLTYLINSSFESGTFPEELKLAKVIQIFKSGDRQDISNYRPISILSFFSKVFEKTMYNHLINFIDANKILYKYADDITVLIEGTSINTMIAALNCELAKLTEWLYLYSRSTY